MQGESAALSLSRLWQQQEQRTEASAWLASIYGWCTEGVTRPISYGKKTHAASRR